MKRLNYFLRVLVMIGIFTIAQANLARASQENVQVFVGPSWAPSDFSSLVTELAQTADVIVIGEKHDTPSVQAIEAKLIEEITRERRKTDILLKSTLGWEFLNASQQTENASAWEKFIQGLTTSEEILKLTQGGLKNKSYLPVLEALKAVQGHLLGLNLTRTEKEPIVKGGLKNIDPALLPPDFAMGSALYRQRFEELMGGSGHATAEQIKNYYEAQCVTDDVMAYHLMNDIVSSQSSQPSWLAHSEFLVNEKSVSSLHPHLSFLIAGSFHTDYSDGVVGRLQSRAVHSGKNLKIQVIRLVDASDYSAAEFENFRSNEWNHTQYGLIADWIITIGSVEKASSRIRKSFQDQEIRNFIKL